MLKKIAAVLALGTASALPGSQALSVPQPPEYSMSADYDVTLLGLAVGSFHLELTMKDGQYRTSATVKPEGLASTFTSNSINAHGNGTGTIGHLIPAYSWVQQVSSKRTQLVEIKYQDGNPVSVQADPVYEVNQWTPTEEQKAGTADPLNAVVALMLMPTAGQGADACGTTIPIYDGKRRYNFLMQSEGEVEIDGGAGGYAGPALHCVIRYQRVAGWDPEHIAKASKTEIHVYMAPIGKTEGGGPGFYLPVRVWSDAEVGSVVAIPANVMINAKPWAEFFAEGG